MYATAGDVRSAVARNLDRLDYTSSLDDFQFEQQIANAQAEVDGRLRGRYSVPFDNLELYEAVPALVVAITTDIAAYLSTLTYYQETELLADDPLTLRYNRAIMLLKDIAMGDIDLDVGDGAGVAPDIGGLGPPVNPYTGSMFGLSDFGLGYGCGDQGWRW